MKCFFNKSFVICLSHIREPDTYTIIIQAYQRVWQEVNMICNYHYITYPESMD